MAIVLGSKVTDSITGFTGIAVSRTTFLHNCHYVRMQPEALIDGKMQDSQYFNEMQLKENDPSIAEAVSPLLGKEVTDKISGFHGVVMSSTEYLLQAPRFCVKANSLFEGKPIEQDFDEGDLIDEESQWEPAAVKTETGGPGDVARMASSPRR